MLTSLYIKNIAVIKELQIDFSKGLTVLTGETGAGKSILIDALFVILGLRVSKEIIRKGEKSLYAEASFWFGDNAEGVLCDYCSDGSLIISREIFSDGRNVVKINARTANTAVLRELAPYLISIHSQSDNQRIFDPEMHYRFLDIYGNTFALYDEYKTLYDEYTKAKNDLFEAENKQQSDSDQIEYLKFVKKDIESADIKENEEEELKSIKQNIKEASKLAKGAAQATGELYENETSAFNLIGNAIDAVKGFDMFAEFSDKLYDIQSELAEISDKIFTEYKNVTDEINEKYTNIDAVEERLNEIYIIKSKYGGTVESTLERLKRVNEELFDMENRENIIDELSKKVGEISVKLTKKANELSEKRRKNAVFLSKAVEYELHELMMPNAKFEVRLEKCDDFTKYGAEKAEFLFSANLGMEPAPLCKIASGGEISRVNLAMKSILNNIDPACAFVFDEIDVGISGRAAQKVAEKMYGISSKNQVLCVTHLPQIAAIADNHLLISKNEDKGETVTDVREIKDNERVKEIARIIGGVSVTELTLKNAEETLRLAQNFKEEK